MGVMRTPTYSRRLLLWVGEVEGWGLGPPGGVVLVGSNPLSKQRVALIPTDPPKSAAVCEKHHRKASMPAPHSQYEPTFEAQDSSRIAQVDPRITQDDFGVPQGSPWIA